MRQKSEARPPLLDKSQQDQALRDLMPVIDWLTNADKALYEGATDTARWSLVMALNALRKFPINSPAVKAYTRWLEQNTEYGYTDDTLQDNAVSHLYEVIFEKELT